MKKVAILTAAGIGSRMHIDIPKQFLIINDKPLIIYTMEAFNNHPDIDGIIVVCLDGWHNILKSYADEFDINKLSSIVSGGKTGLESIQNGLNETKKLFGSDTMVLIHDGDRPMVSQEVISDSIATCESKGNAIAAITCTEVVFECDNKETPTKLLDRDKLKRTQTPHTFMIDDVLDTFKQAEEKGYNNEVATCSLYMKLNKTINFSAGSEKNIKLTTLDDLEIFRSLLDSQNKQAKTYKLYPSHKN